MEEVLKPEVQNEKPESLLDEAKKVRDEIKSLLEEKKALIEREERIKVQELIGGKSEAGIVAQAKVESAQDYAARIMRGGK